MDSMDSPPPSESYTDFFLKGRKIEKFKGVALQPSPPHTHEYALAPLHEINTVDL